MKKVAIYIAILSVSLLFSCKKQTFAKFSYETKPKFEWGFAQFYGNYYSNYNIPNNVVTLHLFTKDLKVVDGRLVGKGQYLILEDVFLAPKDTLLPEGTYLPKATGEPFSFFSGKYFPADDDRNPSGAYLYYIQGNGSQNKVKLIKKGQIDMDIVSDSIYSIDMTLKTADSISIVGTYKNTIPHFDYSLKKKKFPAFILD